MAKKQIKPGPGAGASKSKGKKQKQPTQKTAQQRVMIVGPTGKVRFEWRPW